MLLILFSSSSISGVPYFFARSTVSYPAKIRLSPLTLKLLCNKFFSKHELEMFFMNQMQKRKIIIGVDIEFDKWLGFLVDQGLIAKKEETRLAAMLSSADYHITDKGVAFLTYISNRNYDKKDWGM